MNKPAHLNRSPRGQRRCPKCEVIKPMFDYSRGAKTCDQCAYEPGSVMVPERFSESASATYELYDGADLRPFDGRPGAMDAFGKPSRMDDTLTWRDGRAEKLEMK